MQQQLTYLLGIKIEKDSHYAGIKIYHRRKKRSPILPAATFNRGCSLLIRIKSAEFKLLKLVESSIDSCKYKYL